MLVSLNRLRCPEIDTTSARALRRILGLLSLVHAVTSYPNPIGFYFGPRGLVGAIPYSAPISFVPIDSLPLIYSLALASSIALTAGILPRASLIIGALAYLVLQRWTQPFAWQIDQLFYVAHLYLLFVPTKKKGAAPGLCLMHAQLTVVYLTAAIAKVQSPDWQNGNAALHFLRTDVPLPLTWTVVGLEFCLAIASWFPRLRKPSFLTAVMFHGAIFVFSPIRQLSLLMIFWHLCYVPDWIPSMNFFYRFHSDHFNLRPSASAK